MFHFMLSVLEVWGEEETHFWQRISKHILGHHPESNSSLIHVRNVHIFKDLLDFNDISVDSSRGDSYHTHRWRLQFIKGESFPSRNFFLSFPIHSVEQVLHITSDFFWFPSPEWWLLLMPVGVRGYWHVYMVKLASGL